MMTVLPFMFLASSAAMAQPNCASMADDAERLKCYDAATKAAKPTPKAQIDPVLAVARASIVAKLKDPASARFEGLVRRPEAVCGFVNAKNSMGGYTGRRMFVYVIKEKRGYLLEVGSEDAIPGIQAAETHCNGVPGF